MSKYIIHKIPVDISDAKREEYIRYMIGNIILSNCDIDKYEVTI